MSKRHSCPCRLHPEHALCLCNSLQRKLQHLNNMLPTSLGLRANCFGSAQSMRSSVGASSLKSIHSKLSSSVPSLYMSLQAHSATCKASSQQVMQSMLPVTATSACLRGAHPSKRCLGSMPLAGRRFKHLQCMTDHWSTLLAGSSNTAAVDSSPQHKAACTQSHAGLPARHSKPRTPMPRLNKSQQTTTDIWAGAQIAFT